MRNHLPDSADPCGPPDRLPAPAATCVGPHTASAADSLTVAAPAQTGRSRRPRRALSLTGGLAVSLLGLIVLAALIGPALWRLDPLDQVVESRLQNPSLGHPLGTDQYGRDIFARVLAGAQWSLAGALIVCSGTSLLGFGIGALAASGARVTDTLLGRAIDALMALPSLVTALAAVSVLGPSFPSLLIAMIFTSWPWYARTYRALILRERAAQYVEGARAVGASYGRVVLLHMLPNVIGPAIVIATANFGSIILNLAALSFLGLGMQPPTPEWGMMINEARPFFQRLPWQMIGPGLCIALTVLAVNLSGDALRDLLDPRAQTRQIPRR